MKKLLLSLCVLFVSLFAANFVGAAEPNLDVNTPAIIAIKANMTAPL